MSGLSLFRVSALLALAAVAAAQEQAQIPLAHFSKIDAQVFGGAKPKTDADFQFLQSMHVRYIVNAHFLPFFTGGERRKAAKYGMTLLTFPMNASLVPPSEKHVNQILKALHDNQHQPVYLHCVLGRDRTSLIAGLYKIYFRGISKSQAWQEMKQEGFPSWFGVSGLKHYFDKHAGRPMTN